MTLDEFKATYAQGRSVTEIDATRDSEGNSPWIIVRHGKFTAVISAMPFDDHLCLDVHSFVDGEQATGGVFGMTTGRRYVFTTEGQGMDGASVTGHASHGWPSANLVTVMVGEQT